MIKLIKQSLLTVCCFTFSFAFSQEVAITNSIPTSASAGQPIEAKYNLTKSPTMGSFAKFQVDLPAGFTAESVDIKGGNFTFENNRVKIVWVSLPGDAAFDFVFKITSSATASGSITFAPQFFYLENNVKKEYVVPPSSITFGGDGSAVAASNNTTNATPPATDNSSSTSAGNTDNSSNTTAATPADNTSSSNTTTTDNTNTTNSTPPPPVEKAPAPTPVVNTPPPAAKSNVVFHVQLAALINKPSKSKFAEYGTVKVIEDAGMYKVLVGSFKTLEEARAYKKTLIAKGAEGCFVVAYENGVRIKI
jgi:hypothetical protein